MREPRTFGGRLCDASIGTTRAGFNTNLLAGLDVPLPPLSEQARIVEEAEQQLSILVGIDATVGASLKRAERLRQSILKRAFEGKLVPQDPADEPASVLLERIRAERERMQRLTGKKSALPQLTLSLGETP